MTEQQCWASAAAALSGCGPRPGVSPQEPETFVRWAISHRLARLLYDVADRFDSDAVRGRLFEAACQQVAYTVYQEEELRRVVDHFARAGLSPIFFKGTALAYTSYGDPSLRPRIDTDLLIRRDEVDAMRTALEQLGYRADLQLPGQLVSAQFVYRRIDERGIPHAFDVHLAITNALAYANRLSYEEVAAGAVPIPRLESRALAPSRVHSLIIACIHRVAHHADTDDLLWLYDIHLLARSITEAEWERTLMLAQARQLSGVVLGGIERAERAIGQSAPGQATERLRELASREPPPPLLGSGARTIDLALADFRALSSARGRLQLLAEHLIPAASYMRRAYPRWPAILLPLAYAYRVVRGAPSWFRRT